MSHREPTKITSVLPKRRQDVIRWDGWGYKDSRFVYKDETVMFLGDRYPLNGNLDNFRDWVAAMFGIDLSEISKQSVLPEMFPEPMRNEEFLNALAEVKIDFTEDGMERVMRCHGQTLQDIQNLRQHNFKRIPDVVVWPECHDHVVKIVHLADKHNIALIPVGGNTSVSLSSTTPEIFDRTIAVLDMTQMNRMLWISEENSTACFEVGIVGQDIERVLSKRGFTLGHEPDSHEFSTLGGWIATRASGMKKNRYGNIEDIVKRIKMVTAKGVLEKQFTAPRCSIGPDFDHVVFGSEGTLGIVTEAVVQLRCIPDIRRYESLVFPDFETGVRCLREVAEKRLQPVSIRLIDNIQFKCSVLLDPAGVWFSGLKEQLKKFYLSFICGFDMDKIVAATVLFEGDAESVSMHEKQFYAITKKYGAIKGGEKNGKKGYQLTFVACYVRDIAWDMNIVGESFETAVSWDKCIPLYNSVLARMEKELIKRGIKHYAMSGRVTQSYDTGCSVYFYLLFRHMDDPENSLKMFMEIEEAARDEILACGGSLSHHHGVGKLRSKWYPAVVSHVGVGLYRALKNELDPNNIFAAANILPENPKVSKL
ncbi:alkyldihydroxyacetonephosphate synthase [Culex quinquefasciatus]|uniref:Alkylglycerone-phosphate synthase n=1 Tax=Culex quinquefasciatus TaxID=7176 RepID=B0X355_CULQU|nr:alkyldihydroxyacetonephosphate synthase [Culex quinquefasciatus]|eukprot:XP_001864077.1 alkyldihydroxyacetonephosphate synthase [Culex quinquefasciatus]